MVSERLLFHVLQCLAAFKVDWAEHDATQYGCLTNDATVRGCRMRGYEPASSKE